MMGEDGDQLTASDIEHQTSIPSFNDLDCDDNTEPRIFMSVVHGNGSLGVAFYSIETCVLQVMPDVSETENFDFLKRVFQQVQPSCVVVSAKQDDRMLKALREAAESTGLDADKQIEILPSIDFGFDGCKQRIMLLNLPAMLPESTELDRSMYMSSLVPFDNINMVRAAGALIKFMEKQRIGMELEDRGARVPVLTVRIFSLDNLLLIDENSYNALQIFKLESHPSGFKAETGREGFSLFGVLNRCKSKAGSQLMRMWFRHPLRNIPMINERLDTIDFFVNPQNMEVTAALQNYLKNVKHLGKVMGRMMQAQASLGDWQALYKTVYNAVFVGDLCRSQPEEIAIFRKIGRVFNENLQKIANLIGKIVDFEESAVCQRFVVRSNFDKNLDEKKRTYNGLPDLMTKVAHEEMNNLNDDVPECNVVYLPQLGYLLAFPITDRMKQSHNFNSPTMQFMFASKNMLHYKTESTREMDARLGDTQNDIIDVETSIMHRLQNSILQQADLLLDVLQYSAELDCLITLANCAHENGYCRPVISTSDVIDIISGRHPLQELCCSPFVSNDTHSGTDVGRMKLLTGTNASGKSVYLKQVALIVFMAHIGSFVPAEAATIGIMDKIFTRVHTRESITLNLSSFMIDLSQMSAAVRYATDRSLVIVDEFGKGTEAEDGAALLCAFVKFWMMRGSQCPHVFISTHYHSVIQQILLPNSQNLHFQTMDVMEENGELAFLYQLVDGITNTSYGLHAGMQAGLSKEILDRTKEVLTLRSRNAPISRTHGLSSRAEQKQCKVIVQRFMHLNLEQDDVVEFLRNCVRNKTRPRTH